MVLFRVAIYETTEHDRPAEPMAQIQPNAKGFDRTQRIRACWILPYRADDSGTAGSAPFARPGYCRHEHKAYQCLSRTSANS